MELSSLELHNCELYASILLLIRIAFITISNLFLEHLCRKDKDIKIRKRCIEILNLPIYTINNNSFMPWTCLLAGLNHIRC